jgi:hypothetical protein
MSKREQIDALNNHFLNVWQDINRTLFLMKCGQGDFSEHNHIQTYNARLNFMINCIRDFDIDDTRPWEISEATGRVYYTEGGDDDGDKDSVGEGAGGGAES